MTYNDKVFMLARTWEYKFSTCMTSEDHKQFREECKQAEVDTLDVIAEMDDCFIASAIANIAIKFSLSNK